MLNDGILERKTNKVDLSSLFASAPDGKYEVTFKQISGASETVRANVSIELKAGKARAIDLPAQTEACAAYRVLAHRLDENQEGSAVVCVADQTRYKEAKEKYAGLIANICPDQEALSGPAQSVTRAFLVALGTTDNATDEPRVSR